MIIITSTQLKQASIVFLEHQKLLARDSILTSRIKTYDDVIFQYNIIDSLRQKEVKILKDQVEQDYLIINNLNSKVKKKDRRLKILRTTSGVLAGLSAILAVLTIVSK